MSATLSVLEVLAGSQGGIRRHVAALAEGLERRGVRVAVVAPPGVMGSEVGRSADVELEVGGPRRPWATWSAVRALRPVAAEVDVVHAHGLKAAAVCRWLRRPMVLTVHNVVSGSGGGRVLQAVERLLVRSADQVISVSTDADREVAAALEPRRRHVIVPVAPTPRPCRTGAEVRMAQGIGLDAPLVVAAARLHPQKNLPLLIEAMAEVHRRLPGARLLVVGDGPERQRLERLVLDRGLGGVVRLAGPSANAADELAAADVVALSSSWEGSPVVVAEAVRLGVPLVATDVGDVADTVVDGRSGWLVRPGDVEGLAGALVDALSRPAERAARAATATAIAGHRWDAEALVGEVLEVYRLAAGAAP